MVWFIDKPEMLQDELDRLAAIGATYDVDENAKSEGRIVINVQYRIDNNDLDFICIFPAEYPFFPPEIQSQNFPSGRHLEPFGKSLCTFADKNNKWDIANDTLAGLFENQITNIYKIHKDPTLNSEHEDKFEGYQPSGQLVAEQNSVIVVTSDCDPGVSEGRGYVQISHVKDAKKEAIRGCLSKILDTEGKMVFQDETTFSDKFSIRLPIRWCKITAPLSAVDARGIYQQVITEFPNMEKTSSASLGKIGVDIIGVCFNEESNRGTIEVNWLFLVRRIWKEKKNTHVSLSIIRSDHLHPNQLLARTPNLIGLAGKTVTIVGLGALGSQVAFQLARAGVKHFKLIDRDYLQVGNLQRWALGLPFIGMSKVHAVSRMLTSGFVGLSIHPIECEIGSTQEITLEDGSEVLFSEYFSDEIIQKSDLVIDCSAMLNVNQYVSQLCKTVATDYVWCSATNGAWGGIVGRSTAHCDEDVWYEFNNQYGNNVIPEIATEPTGFVQPKGCFHPTFTGAGFDLDTVSNMTSRMAVSILQGDVYGLFEDDVYVVDQWAEGNPVAPVWKGFKYQHG
ncbi:ThiF family adenylyltransferase [Alteromonas antoniana]|uniref:ThiF family adenylyltransferase n=1 Tax=Alteromonas antoniana TaxID=2803813 RepID=UPI001C472339|nr:ThiF family adenylyltransferase [Alteromonas antoniana]